MYMPQDQILVWGDLGEDTDLAKTLVGEPIDEETLRNKGMMSLTRLSVWSEGLECLWSPFHSILALMYSRSEEPSIGELFRGTE